MEDFFDNIGNGLLAIGGSLIGGMFSSSNNRETNAANLEIAEKINENNLKLAQQQNDWNLAQWQRQNEYNSPLAQMQRYRAAGLNPNLIYSQGNPGNASSLSSANLANQQAAKLEKDTLTPTLVSEAFKQIQDFAFRSIQARQLEAQTDKIRADIKKTDADTLATLEGNQRARDKFGLEKSYLGHQDDLIVEQRSKLAQDIALSKYMQDNYYPAQINSLKAGASNSWSNSMLNRMRVANMQAGLPADGGSLLERSISSFLSGMSGGKIKSPFEAIKSSSKKLREFATNPLKLDSIQFNY